MIVDLYKTGMSLADLSSEYGITKSAINGWIKDIKEVKIDENEVMTLKEVKSVKKWKGLKRKMKYFKKIWAYLKKEIKSSYRVYRQ